MPSEPNTDGNGETPVLTALLEVPNVLNRAWDRIQSPEKWAPSGVEALDSEGSPVSCDDPDAVRWSALGSVFLDETKFTVADLMNTAAESMLDMLGEWAPDPVAWASATHDRTRMLFGESWSLARSTVASLARVEPVEKLTVAALTRMRRDTIFAAGVVDGHRIGMPGMLGARLMMWAAVRGNGPHWTIRADTPRPLQNVAERGDRVHVGVKDLVACDAGALARYRL